MFELPVGDGNLSLQRKPLPMEPVAPRPGGLEVAHRVGRFAEAGPAEDWDGSGRTAVR
jgi:hypothetical protein